MVHAIEAHHNQVKMRAVEAVLARAADAIKTTTRRRRESLRPA